MCGINGIFSKNKLSDIESRVQNMNKALAHRGPDADGFFLDNNILALGHRRLSIIDTGENANQPLSTHNNVWQIVFNGEIYNFKEIKSELNYSFKTNSDTEVILAAVQEKGIDWFIGKANGMFAIALYNTIEKNLFLIRDRLGIKPLFYYHDNEKFIFSSEIKGILNSGLIDARFNETAVDEYLANRYIRAPYTFFEKIFQIEPGEYLIIDTSINKKTIKYWDLPSKFNVDKKYNEEEILSKFDIELNKAIKYRLISDVPLGTYLSGGVDSSLITAITALNKNNPVNTYTIGFPELNEFEYSKIVSERYNTSHHEILITKDDYVNNWEKLIEYKDAPLGVPNEIPLALMSNELKKKITVVLSGEGADELMGGYGRIFRSPFDYKNHNISSDFYNYFISLYEYVPREMRDKYINTPKEYRNIFDNKIKKVFTNTPNEENVFRFFHKYHVTGLLQRVDITTMQTSVEARVPFLDHKLIEFVYEKIPYDLKLKWKNVNAFEKSKKLQAKDYSEELDTPKYLLRKLAYKYLPDKIIERKKVGFPVPLTEWFSNLEILANDLLYNAPWLKKDLLPDLISNSKKENRAGQILWMFINIEMFRKKYFEKNWKY